MDKGYEDSAVSGNMSENKPEKFADDLCISTGQSGAGQGQAQV